MKKLASFEFFVGIVGLVLWVLHVLCGINIFWVVLPMVFMGVCAIPFWFARKQFSIPEGFEASFKKNNIITLIVALVIAVIAYFGINPTGKAGGWDVWAYFVYYAFIFCHGAGLFFAYNKFLKKK